MKSCLDTGRATRAIDILDDAYQVLKDDAKAEAARSFAAEQARGYIEILRTEAEWTAAVLRAAVNDLKVGRTRTHQTWYAIGTLAAHFGKLDFAVTQYEQAIRNAPLNGQADAYTQLIHVLDRSRKSTELEAVCREGLRNPMLFAGYFNSHLASALADQGKAEEAIATADKAIVQSGGADRLGSRLLKVSVLNKLAKWDEAIALGKKLLGEFNDEPDRIRIKYSLATSYSGAKMHAESEAELRAILELDPDHTGACNDLGYHLAEQGRNLDEAERLVRRAIAIDRMDRRRSGTSDPDHAAYLDSLAWVLFRREKLAEARDLLVKASALPEGGTDGTVFDHLGDIHFRLGDKDKARTAWQEAERLLGSNARGKRDGRLDDVKRKLKRLP